MPPVRWFTHRGRPEGRAAGFCRSCLPLGLLAQSNGASKWRFSAVDRTVVVLRPDPSRFDELSACPLGDHASRAQRAAGGSLVDEPKWARPAANLLLVRYTQDPSAKNEQELIFINAAIAGFGAVEPMKTPGDIKRPAVDPAPGTRNGRRCCVAQGVAFAPQCGAFGQPACESGRVLR